MSAYHRAWFFVILVGMTTSGCGSSQSGLALPASASSSIREEFDPFTLNDDDFLLQPITGGKAISESKSPISVTAPQPTSSTAAALGYRIQIAAVLDRSRAEALQQELQRQLQVLTYLYYDTDTHLYKIQAGNNGTPAEAESLKERVRTKGYPEAYVVRTQIEVTDTRPTRTTAPTKTRGFRLQVFSASTGRRRRPKQCQAAPVS